jgi:Flp pilus assembly protein TadB
MSLDSNFIKWLIGALGAAVGFLFLRLKSSQKSQAEAESGAAKATYQTEIKAEEKKYEETKLTANALVDDYERARAEYARATKPKSDT